MNDLERDHRDDSVEGVLDKAARTALAKQAMEIEFKPIDTDIALKKQKATRIPFEGVAALGVGLLPMGDSLRTVTQAVTIPNNGLLQAFDKFGNLVDIQTLSRFNDGTGMMGSRIHPVNGFEQIRFQEAGSQVVDVATQLPYDPTTLLVAAALMEINKKLDAIQETQQEMFEYIRQKDKAALRGNLETLASILDDYAFNWNNETYKTNKHIQVQEIRQQAEQTIIQHRVQIMGHLEEKGFLHFDKDVNQRMAKLVDGLGEYRLSLHLYAFSSFLEVMLLENFDAGYLESVASRIEERSLAYRDMYSRCYDALDGLAKTSLETLATKGIAKAGSALGGALSKTPIGRHTPIDTGLQDASKFLSASREAGLNTMMGQLHELKMSDVRPFVDNIRKVNELYNRPTELYLDEDAVYVLTVG